MTHFYSQNIKSIMDENVVTLYKSDTVNNAIAMLLKRNLTCLPVVDEERKMLGVINYQTLIDLFLHGTGIERNMNISNVITKDYFVYRENEKLTSYNPRVNEPSFVINEYDQIVGIIHPEQVIKRLMNKKDEWQTAEEIIELYEFCF